MLRPILLLASLLAALFAPALHAQVIRGSVFDRESGAPVATAFVVLLNDADATLAGVLTDADGVFFHRPPRPGRYRVRVERIGFQSEVSEAVEVAAGETVSLRVGVRTQAIALPPVTAEGERRCRMPRDEGVLLYRLWEESRKALSIAAWTEQQSSMHVRTRLHERTLHLVTLEVLDQRVRSQSGYSRNPFVSSPPEELAREGYIRPAGEGYSYYGLSARTIISDAFQDTHCFRVRPPDDDQPATEIGLAFEPARGRTVPDVSGVLWLDRETAALLRIEYTYHRHPHRVPVPVDAFGGRTELRRLANGAWIVERWWLRMPQFERVIRSDELPAGLVSRGRVRGLGERQALQRVGLNILEVGGSVASVSLPGTGRGGTAVVTGVVYDSIAARPLAGAIVYLDGADAEAGTDADGRFSIDDVAAGQWTVSFHHPAMDALAADPAPAVVRVGAGDTARVTLATPSAESILATRCPAGGWVGGFVRGEGGAPLEGVVVVAEWDEEWRRRGDGTAAIFSATGAERGAVTDDAGAYVLCDVTGVRVRLRADAGEGRVRRAEVRLDAGEGARVDFAFGRM